MLGNYNYAIDDNKVRHSYYTLERDVRELQPWWNVVMVFVNYTLERDVRELQLCRLRNFEVYDYTLERDVREL